MSFAPPGPESRPSYSILTFGCRVNQADSLEIEEALRLRGAERRDPERADVVVVNTCTVTGASDQGARQTIRRIARANPRARIVVTGCYATRRPDEIGSLPNVACVMPNGEKASIAQVLGRTLGVTAAEPFVTGDGPCGRPLEPGVMGRTAIPLRVQTGCGEACAFCVIPATRGPSRSRPVARVLADVDRLAASGYREIWLVGVHLGAYGRDLPRASSLDELARALDAVRADVTYRISSLEPMDCSERLIDLVARSGRFAPHLHLPLQHGSDRVLGVMRRPYSVASFESIVRRIADRIPQASIGTDVMAGFPGETPGEAEETARVVERLPLSYLHVFPYSDRPGTEASSLRPKVSGLEIRDRAARLRAIGGRHAARFAAGQVGAVRPGLTLEDGALVLTDNFLKVRIPPGLPRNTRVRVRIEEAGPPASGVVVPDPASPFRS